MPHVVAGSGFDLNETFIEPYVRNRNEVMFCPGIPLRAARHPDFYREQDVGDYRHTHILYQYFIWTGPNGQSRDAIPHNVRPTQLDAVHTRAPLWGCLTVAKSSDRFLAHDRDPNNRGKPRGMTVGFLDASAEWVHWEDMEMFTSGAGGDFYWPTPDATLRRGLRRLHYQSR